MLFFLDPGNNIWVLKIEVRWVNQVNNVAMFLEAVMSQPSLYWTETSLCAQHSALYKTGNKEISQMGICSFSSLIRNKKSTPPSNFCLGAGEFCLTPGYSLPSRAIGVCQLISTCLCSGSSEIWAPARFRLREPRRNSNIVHRMAIFYFMFFFV